MIFFFWGGGGESGSPVLPSGSAHDMPHTGPACVNNIVTDPPVTEKEFDQGDCLFDIIQLLTSMR